MEKRKHFHEKPLYFRTYAEFEADIEIDKSSVGNKTTNNFKQNPILNGYKIVSGLIDISESGDNISPLSYDNVGWFVNETFKIEKKDFLFYKH